MPPSARTSPWTPLLMSWTILGWSRSRPVPSHVWAGGFSSRARYGFNGLAGHGLSDRKLETRPGPNNYCLKKLGDLFVENDRKHGLDGLTKMVRLKHDMIEMGRARAKRLRPQLGWIWACGFLKLVPGLYIPQSSPAGAMNTPGFHSTSVLIVLSFSITLMV